MAVETLTHHLLQDGSLPMTNLNGPATTVKHIPGLLSAEPDLFLESVVRYFGGNGYIADEKTVNKVRCTIVDAFDLISPKATYTLCPVLNMIPGKELCLEKGLKLSIPDCHEDTGTRLVAAAVGTLGNKLEKQCRKLARQGDIYESTLLDAVGTAMLDFMGEKIFKTIEQEGSKLGLARGLRFAPGLEGYPLEQQQLLFQIADNGAVGVHLNPSAIMIPGKSISFFLTLTKTPFKRGEANKCSSCRMAKCRFRMGTKDNPLKQTAHS